tara:strand:- start:216 stop:494 length:279 start_codon:yes stop_codon:yes gene_type:complete
LKHHRIFRLDTWEEREEREERKESAADLAECGSTVCTLKEEMLRGHVNASQGDGETKQRGHDFEIAATVRSGHKRRGEREGRDLIYARLIGA